jgi:hypothetical protein
LLFFVTSVSFVDQFCLSLFFSVPPPCPLRVSVPPWSP